MKEAERESWKGYDVSSKRITIVWWLWVTCVKASRPFKVQRAKFSEDFPEAAIREGADELTLRAEEVGTLKDCINIDHIEDDRWGPPYFDVDWHAFCLAIYKGSGGEKWEELYFHNRDMSRATGAKKPSESQKAKALWATKAAKHREEEFYDPAHKDNILGRKQTRLGAVGRAPQGPNHSPG